MLVLTRKAGDEIVIDERIRLKVIRIQGSRIRLGIEAPDCFEIRRGELSPREVCDHSDRENACPLRTSL